MLPLPQQEDSLNVRALARVEREDFTGIVGTSVTLSQNVVEAAAPPGSSTYLDVYKNGLLLSNAAGAAYSIAGRTLTLNVALIAGDVLVVKYWARAN